MNKAIMALMVIFIGLDLAVLLGVPKLQNFDATPAIAAAVPMSMAVPLPSHCPNIDAAIDAIKGAQRDLHEARHDFCGHKQAAIEATEHAVAELRAAQACAKCRD